ncbi:MAG: peptidoglycan DD-metalloendopeptidase family protein [Gammaproteobacteria bacterium]
MYSCGGNVRAPVEAPGEQPKKVTLPPAGAKVETPARGTAPGFHIVNKGDTLYSIAWNYGFDYRDVAAWNSINPPYVIYPGQRLRLNNTSAATPATRAQPAPSPDPVLTPGPIIIRKKPGAEETVQKENIPVQISPGASPTPAPVAPSSFNWLWPTQGKIVKADTPIAKNGIDIAGTKGQKINASAAGEVVYSGSGLLGYGRLIIIKHNDTFLSAYAHNSELLVQEGEHVQGGQDIALMGEANNGKAYLHFEIRKNGQPVDPLKYLPKSN